MKLLGIISVDFDIIDQPLTRYYVFIRYWRKNGRVHELFIDFEKAHDSVIREVLNNILIDFGISVTLVRFMKCLNETYSKSPQRWKYIWCISYSEWLETRRCFIAFALEYAIGKDQ